MDNPHRAGNGTTPFARLSARSPSTTSRINPRQAGPAKSRRVDCAAVPLNGDGHQWFPSVERKRAERQVLRPHALHLKPSTDPLTASLQAGSTAWPMPSAASCHCDERSDEAMLGSEDWLCFAQPVANSPEAGISPSRLAEIGFVSHTGSSAGAGPASLDT